MLCYQVREFDLAVVNIHLRLTSEDGQTEQLDNTISAIEQHLQGEKDVVLLGDFNAPPDSEGTVFSYQKQVHNLRLYFFIAAEIGLPILFKWAGQFGKLDDNKETQP